MRAALSVAFNAGLVLLLTSTSILRFVGLPSVSQAASPYDDEFDSPTLDPNWSFDNADSSHWSLTANHGYFRIATQLGNMPPGGDTGEARNVLLQQPPAGDYDITTRVNFRPGSGVQQAGLVIEDPNDNDDVVLKLVRVLVNDQQSVGFALATDGWNGFQERFEPFPGGTTYLKIQKRGRVFTGSFSPDGGAWTQLASYDAPALTSGRIGIAAFNATTAPEINADFDYFRVETDSFARVPPVASSPTPVSTVGSALARVPTVRSLPSFVTRDDEFDGPSLDPKWSLDNEDRTRWSLTANPGYMRIVSQLGNMPPGDTGEGRNVLLQRPLEGNYEITTRVEFNPTRASQQAGIVVEDPAGGGNTFLKLVRIATNDGQSVDFALATDGWNGFQERFEAFAGATTYLKILKRGTVFTGFVSPDGVNWTQVASYDTPILASGRIGVAAFNAATAPEINADFDYFRVQTRERPPTPVPTRGGPASRKRSPC